MNAITPLIRGPFLLSGLLLSTFFLAPVAQASSLDSFDPNINRTVNSIAVQADGKILVGGGFNMIGGVTRNSIARLNTDGTLDNSFNYNENVASAVLSIAVQADAKILIGGAFITLTGPTRRRIARLNADGTLDTSFTAIIPSGSGDSVSSIAIQADGKILIGGTFSAIQGTGEGSSTPRNNIARLNPDGSLDTTFDPDVNMFINSVVVQADGKILIGGGFTSVVGTGGSSATTRNRIARLNANGSLDATFDPNSNNTIRSIAVQADDKILIGGGFTSIVGTGGASSTTRNRIARLNADGTLDTAFNPNSNGNVESIATQTNGNIVISGQFTTIGSSSRSRIAHLDANGSLDSDFDTGLTNNGFVWAIALQADGKTLAGGFFDSIDNTTRNNIARISSTDAPAPIVNVASDGNQASWLRSGSAPEITRASLETSLDGMNWSNPVAGQRINGGWQFSNLNIQTGTPTNLRFRGFYGVSPSITQTLDQVLLPSGDTDDDLCLPIKTTDNNLTLVCL